MTDLPRLTAAFQDEGYCIIRDAASSELVARLRAIAERDLAADRGPLERETEVRYPGSPPSIDSPGGTTVRRLLRADQRDPAFAEWIRSPAVVATLRALLNSRELYFCPAHHNCVMTKQPSFSSDTGWHQDIRYWRFSDRQLVNAWLALTPETAENGGLRIIPGSHREPLTEDRLDSARFLREDLPANHALLQRARQLTLAPGDLVFFHAAILHSASRNRTDETKYSAVFTYHGENTRPIPETKSASIPEVRVG
ncbi:MAG: phytanoyl-CoA dioxygenase family protein [Xanthomonadales bacterium]|nr:phytanoyl-CoA dioxygenase family protein [Xanthomonadales bacterium]